MKKKPKYACLKRRKSKSRFIKWPTLREYLDKLRKECTHEEYQELFLGKFLHAGEDLIYKRAKIERQHMDQFCDELFKSLKELRRESE